MRVERVDPYDDASHLAWFGPVRASEEREWPGEPGWLEGELRALNRDGATSRSLLGLARADDGEAAGSLLLRLPQRDNQLVADLLLAVGPQWRGRGVGQLLIATAERWARAEGRSKLVAATDEPASRPQPSRNARFAVRAGFEAALGEARRLLELPAEEERLRSLEAECTRWAAGYRTITWRGHCPERLASARAALARRISEDAPQGKLAAEPEEWDVARVRSFEALCEEMGRELYAAGAVTKDGGELVAVSEIAVSRWVPVTCYQQDTIVLPEHRGHRLGTLVKIANLRALAASSPATRRVLTWNASSNGPMVAVNEALGFRLVGTGTLWQKALD